VIKLTSLSVGYCTHPACMALKGAGRQVHAFPARCYLFETSRGIFLWDTGYAEHFHDATASGVYRLYAKVTPVHFNCADSLEGQLDARGIMSSEVRGIFMSHFHADHIAGLKDFPGATFFCSKTGWDVHKGKRGISALRRGFLPGLIPDDIESRLAFVDKFRPIPLPEVLAPFEQGFDVLGTGELLVVPLPGHAEGHLGAFVLTENGWELLASDSAWMPESYRDLRGPSELSFIIQHRRGAYYQTLRKLNALHHRSGVRIHLTHESPLASNSPDKKGDSSESSPDSHAQTL
jgi:glyoxylase-like metal-dependent hydrolase (beta-lactamase superfamily II)